VPPEVAGKELLVDALEASLQGSSSEKATRGRKTLISEGRFLISEENVEEAIKMTMTTSGATILMSGFTLTMSFLFLALSPVSMIASLGQGCALTMGVMVLVNLTLTPALLSTAPLYFARTCCETSCALESRHETPGTRETSLRNVPVPDHQKIWNAVARITTTWPWNLLLLIIVFLGTSVVARFACQLQVSNEFTNVAARGSVYAKIGARITEDFGPSQLYPYKLLMRPRSGEPIFGPSFYSKSAEFLTALEADVVKGFPEAKGSTYAFLAYKSDGRGNSLTTAWDGVEFLCYSSPPPFGLTEQQRRAICAFQLHGLTNVKDYSQNATDPPTATFGLINAAVDPTGHSGVPFLKALRQGCSKLGRVYAIECYVGGMPPQIDDEVKAVYDYFPGMIAATFAISMTILGVSFRSVVIPLRSLITNALTLGFVYGVSVLIYQRGILDWTGWGSVGHIPEGLNFTLPVIMFSMITGICSDYDIFLLVRIMEYRSAGVDPRTSVQKGLSSTGGIITAAGVIMAIAFGGLLFSSIPSVNVMGLMMVAAVLYDTFVARCIVNPAVMSLLGRYNWWPSRLSGDISLQSWYMPLSSGKPSSPPRTNGQMEGSLSRQVECGHL
jgi:uncharacterized membrane protein YdfJ with MMPL/SSD domain